MEQRWAEGFSWHGVLGRFWGGAPYRAWASVRGSGHDVEALGKQHALSVGREVADLVLARLVRYGESRASLLVQGVAPVVGSAFRRIPGAGDDNALAHLFGAAEQEHHALANLHIRRLFKSVLRGLHFNG